MLTEAKLRQLLDAFPSVKIAVVGDFFLDKYLDCDQALSELSLETGLEAFQVVKVRCYPGAAGTIVNNLKALKVGRVYAVGFIGDDGEGYELRRALLQNNVDITHLQIRNDSVTPTYIKPTISVSKGRIRELNRLDIKNRCPLPEELQRRIITSVQTLLPKVDAVVVSDQVSEVNCGVISDEVRLALIELAERYSQKLFYADSRQRIGQFPHFTIKPNRYEVAKAILGDVAEGVTFSQAVEFGQILFERNQKPVFLTVGGQGIVTFCDEGIWHIPAVPVKGEIDITGAGDSVTSGIVPALCLTAHPIEAAIIGNLVASVTIEQIGLTGIATPQQVLEQFQRYANTIEPSKLS